MDNRLDKVKDWEIIEKGSNINEIIKNSSILVKNKYNRYGHGIIPKYPIKTMLVNSAINFWTINDSYFPHYCNTALYS